MLLQFTVGNFLSIKEKRTFTMESTSIKDIPISNIVHQNKYRILRTAGIYGANSSGKSNFIKAFAAMGNMVITSVKLNDNEELMYDPFLLSTETEDAPTFFEIVYLKDNTRYRYGFEYNLTDIIGEWLFLKDANKQENILFLRNKDGIGVGENFLEGVDLEEKTNNNRLFLSLVAQLGGQISKQILDWFSKEFNVLSGLSSKGYTGFTKKMLLEQNDICKESLSFFKTLQLGFDQIFANEREFEETQLPEDLPQNIRRKLVKDLEGKKSIDVLTVHKKYNKKGQIVGDEIFNILERESSGTNKLFDLAGPIFDSLLKGKILIIDELDAKMHPLISQYIIDLFNNPLSNKYNAQLIFTTHDTHLLSTNILRRDQIWFTEKDNKESTDIYSMMDVVLPDGSKPRNDSNYEKNYINGRYGAIPFIKNF